MDWGDKWMSLVCLILAPAAYKNARAAYGWFGKGREAMIGLDQKTAQVHLIFSVLLSAGPTVALVVTTIVYALVNLSISCKICGNTLIIFNF